MARRNASREAPASRPPLTPAVAPTGPTITENPSSTPYSPTSGGFDSPLVSFPYYPLYTLDYIQGNVLFPGGEQLATLDGNVDLAPR